MEEYRSLPCRDLTAGPRWRRNFYCSHFCQVFSILSVRTLQTCAFLFILRFFKLSKHPREGIFEGARPRAIKSVFPGLHQQRKVRLIYEHQLLDFCNGVFSASSQIVADKRKQSACLTNHFQAIGDKRVDLICQELSHCSVVRRSMCQIMSVREPYIGFQVIKFTASQEYRTTEHERRTKIAKRHQMRPV